jgi:hypothetical protein
MERSGQTVGVSLHLSCVEWLSWKGVAALSNKIAGFAIPR